MQLRVTVENSLSLGQLAAIATESDGAVWKTPHVGNHYPNNLMIAGAGIPVVCYDRTFGERDMNFHPSRVIKGHRALQITCAERLTTHTKVTRPPSDAICAEYFPSGASVHAGHMRSLRDAIPAARARSFSDVLEQHGDLVLALLDCVHQQHPDLALPLWYRKVREDGKIIKTAAPTSWAQVRSNLYGLTNPTAGWLTPNVMNVLLSAILQQREASGRNTVYHLSGPDMIRYIGQKVPNTRFGFTELVSLLGKSASSIGLNVDVEFVVVPVATARFICQADQADQLDELFARLVDYRAHEAALRALPDKQSLKKTFWHEADVGRKERGRVICEYALGCPDVFRDIGDASSISQYDLLAGTRLHVNEQMLSLPIGEVNELYQLARKLTRSVH